MAILSASVSRGVVAAKKIFPCIRLAILLLLTVGWQNLHAQTASKEYQVKAAFLYNFSQFVEWPPDAFPQAQSPLVIGILGDDPFGGSLDQIVSGEKVNGHPLVIQHYHSVGEIKACHILFISQSEGKESKAVLSALKGRDILTVSDLDDFTKDGGIIRFVTENNKIRFKINGEAAKAANLTLSSKLLRAAE